MPTVLWNTKCVNTFGTYLPCLICHARVSCQTFKHYVKQLKYGSNVETIRKYEKKKETKFCWPTHSASCRCTTSVSEWWCIFKQWPSTSSDPSVPTESGIKHTRSTMTNASGANVWTRASVYETNALVKTLVLYAFPMISLLTTWGLHLLRVSYLESGQQLRRVARDIGMRSCYLARTLALCRLVHNKRPTTNAHLFMFQKLSRCSEDAGGNN